MCVTHMMWKKDIFLTWFILKQNKKYTYCQQLILLMTCNLKRKYLKLVTAYK